VDYGLSCCVCESVVGHTGTVPSSSSHQYRQFRMEEQLIEVDSIADLCVALEDAVAADAVVNVGGKVLPEQPEVEVLGKAEGFAAGDLGDIDIETPSRTADSISATAGTSPRRANSLLDNLSRRIVPSWLGWSGRGAVRSDPMAVRHAQQHSRGGSRSTRSVDRVPDDSGVPAHPRMYETPRNANVLPQGQIRHEGAYAAHPGMLFDVPLEPAEEAVYANPTFTVPV